jgi:hypothetical protein
MATAWSSELCDEDQQDRPKTFIEMQAQAAERSGCGLRCPYCGCVHLGSYSQQAHDITRTIPLGRGQSIRRRRVCRNCGREFTTSEQVV